ncbi:Lrp/AsnC family transcriptional regulator, leucine-responsive regulatory protein [Rhizobium mongolense subsp. loessense]|uniref:Lrp/AsnC family transcriptional regulator, leucine-responsive regulatory protein n=1 Tax=Rhizobium mongolense subsp. loessense TaxID=158890 RepID=A0A1G4Q7K9_9HYPH|nr:Lrp/AsnC family transcriptional regulator, leucine-responsive regulatory protein [Rhizobium mongolense subsp. loessense]
MMAVIRLPSTHQHIRPSLKQFYEIPQVVEVLRLTGEAVAISLVLRGEPPKPIGRDLSRLT